MTSTTTRAATSPRVLPTPVQYTRPRRSEPHGSLSAHVVHLAGECAPFARTGGLGEVVRTLAEAQAASGMSVSIIMPLYGTIRGIVGDLALATDSFAVRVGSRQERVRLLRTQARAGEPVTFFVDHPVFSSRRGLYGDGGDDYSDNAFRFALFSLAALTALPQIAPDASVLHAHDWHAALAPVYLRTVLRNDPAIPRLATVLSVHNAGFQGHYPPDVMSELGLSWDLYDWRRFEWYGRMNVLKGGLTFADVVTTVSPTHARELRTPLGGFGLHETFASLGDRLVGVLNGIDQHTWDPATDPHLPAQFSAGSLAGKGACKAALQRAFRLAPRPDVPLFALCARMVAQKGIDTLLDSGVLDRGDAQFILLGEGDTRYTSALAMRAVTAPESIGVQLDFTDRMEHLLLAGADACLVPSVYEPCGLTQMRAQRYGTLPVAHRVGGLADTIDEDTGFLFTPHTPAALAEAVERAVSAYADESHWRTRMHAAMRNDFGWERSAAMYREVYRRAGALSHA
ncbi:MAG TPA: glycogen/starch synthase [Gemmatimonadaceae bacterium]|nr:glycogen/starch synthase [Gemmatimonadaceae bacterium]